ncbi:plasmid partitioning protein [Microcystis phage Mwe-Yong1]|nr:plasmid partitioning protein [Microcystis phage Mwe-Yong1]
MTAPAAIQEKPRTMTTRKPLTIALADIDVDDRIQRLDEAKAMEIAASIEAHQRLFQPIGLRQTPKGAKGWRLVFGRHRLRALELRGVVDLVEGEHFVRIVADATEGRLIEIEENLARNDTTPFARALMLVAYREACGVDGGRGGDRRSAEYRALAEGFTAQAMSIFDLSPDQLSRLLQIGTKLSAPAGLADRLQLSRIARNQSQLLKLAALPDEQLERAAEAFDAAKGDFFGLMQIVSVSPDKQAKLLGRLAKGASLADLGDAKPKPAPAFDHWQQAVSSYSQLDFKGRVSATVEHFRHDEKAFRAALESLGYQLVERAK